MSRRARMHRRRKREQACGDRGGRGAGRGDLAGRRHFLARMGLSPRTLRAEALMGAPSAPVTRRRRAASRRRGPAPEPITYVDPAPPPSLLGRALSVNRHLAGLLAGSLVAWADARHRDGTGRGPRYLLARGLSPLVRSLLRPDLARVPFPVHLRRRLELLGPTYIKLGQILS